MTVHSTQTRNNDKDVVEIVFSALYNKIPRPIRDFIDDCQYTLAYAEKHRLTNWWIYKQVGRAFRSTGCAQWTFVWLWPWLCELREYYLDVLAISQCPLAFVCGFGLGTFLDANSLRSNITNKRSLVLRLHDYKSAVHVDGDDVAVVDGNVVGHTNRLDPTKRVVNFLVNCTVPIIGIYFIPKLVNTIASNTNNVLEDVTPSAAVSVCANAAVGIAGSLALSIACFQGWFSTMRCRNRLTQRELSLTEEQKQHLQTALQLLPVHIKATTVQKVVSLLPAMYNAGIVSTHIRLLRGKGGVLVDCCMIGLGLIVWERASFRRTV